MREKSNREKTALGIIQHSKFMYIILNKKESSFMTATSINDPLCVNLVRINMSIKNVI